MTGKKRKLIAMISLVTGICIFTVAAVANLATASGYEVYKNALFGLMNGVDNYTLRVEAVEYFDNVEDDRFVRYEMYSATGDANLYSEDMYYNNGRLDADERNICYMQDGIEINVSIDEKGEEFVRVYDDTENDMIYYFPDRASAFGDGVGLEDEESQKIIRFMELLADTLVGDLKNNFVYVAGDENSKKYAITLDGMQVPELVNAGLSLSASTAYLADDDPMLLLGKEPVVRYGTLVFSVDDEGRLTQNDFYLELVGLDEKGKEHTAVLKLSLEISDYGTTVPKRADLDNMNVDRREDYGIIYDSGFGF